MFVCWLQDIQQIIFLFYLVSNKWNEKELADRGQAEIMKLSLDWSAPNPLIPSDLDLHFVMFNQDGEGICGTYNLTKNSKNAL